MLSTMSELRVFAIRLIALVACLPDLGDSLIITSVLAGDKKFKTISFDHKWLKPLTFEKEMPNTEFRRHRTVRPPKFDIDVNIPIKLPLEDEYPHEEYKKPVESNIFFQTGELNEPSYGGAKTYGGSGQQKYSQNSYSDEYAAASDNQAQSATGINLNMKDGFKGLLPSLMKSIKFRPQIVTGDQARADVPQSNARSDFRDALQSTAGDNAISQQPFNQMPMAMPMIAQESIQVQERNYAPPHAYQSKGGNYANSYDPEFIPGGFVNLKLSGPTGGPKMTYEDFDKERWAQQLSQTAGAMPYPILNYHQLQNFYGGLGTFTNGLAEHRYVETGLLDKFKSGLNHITSKFHFG